ncbi:MAG: proteinsubtilase family protease, partial [Phycisphaerales bacterium]|nr:proteinsubtilase family protease [Phycisphaerales bacterium]
YHAIRRNSLTTASKPPPPPPPPPPPVGPAADLVAEVAKATMPSAVASQTKIKGSISVRVTNAGDLSLSGLVPISIRLTAGDSPTTDDVEVLRTFKELRLKPGQAKTLKFAISQLPDVDPGTYHLGVILDPEDAMVEKLETNNTAESAATYAVADPFVTLTGAYRGTPTGLASGKAGRASLDLTNAGNVPASGVLDVTLYLSSDDEWDAGDLLVGAVPLKLKLKAGTVKANKVKVIVPVGMAAGTYFLIAKLDAATVQPTPADADSVTASGAFTL